MSNQDQVQAVQQQIEDALRKVSESEASLALEKQAGHKMEVDFLCSQLENLDTQLVSLREKENLSLASSARR